MHFLKEAVSELRQPLLFGHREGKDTGMGSDNYKYVAFVFINKTILANLFFQM